MNITKQIKLWYYIHNYMRIFIGRKENYEKIITSLKSKLNDDTIENIQKMGFVRAIIDGEQKDLSFDEISLDKNKKHNIDIVVDRLVIKEGIRTRLAESIEIAMKHADNNIIIDDLKEKHKFSRKLCMSRTSEEHIQI